MPAYSIIRGCDMKKKVKIENTIELTSLSHIKNGILSIINMYILCSSK